MASTPRPLGDGPSTSGVAVCTTQRLNDRLSSPLTIYGSPRVSAAVVAEQGELIDRIDSNAEASLGHIGEAHSQILK